MKITQDSIARLEALPAPSLGVCIWSVWVASSFFESPWMFTHAFIRPFPHPFLLWLHVTCLFILTSWFHICGKPAISVWVRFVSFCLLNLNLVDGSYRWNLGKSSLRNQLFIYSSSEEPVNCLGIWAILLSRHISGESLALPIQAVPDPTLSEHTEGLNPNSFFFTPYPDTWSPSPVASVAFLKLGFSSSD